MGRTEDGDQKSALIFSSASGSDLVLAERKDIARYSRDWERANEEKRKQPVTPAPVTGAADGDSAQWNYGWKGWWERDSWKQYDYEKNEKTGDQENLTTPISTLHATLTSPRAEFATETDEEAFAKDATKPAFTETEQSELTGDVEAQFMGDVTPVLGGVSTERSLS